MIGGGAVVLGEGQLGIHRDCMLLERMRGKRCSGKKGRKEGKKGRKKEEK